MDPASDTNIVGDNITMSAQPTFDGTISEPNPTLVNPAGQTAILDIGIALMVNGVLTTYFDPSQVPAADCPVHPAECGHGHLDHRRRRSRSRWVSTEQTRGS